MVRLTVQDIEEKIKEYATDLRWRVTKGKQELTVTSRRTGEQHALAGPNKMTVVMIMSEYIIGR